MSWATALAWDLEKTLPQLSEEWISGKAPLLIRESANSPPLQEVRTVDILAYVEPLSLAHRHKQA